MSYISGNLSFSLLAAYLTLTGCATPSERFAAEAARLGFTSQKITSARYPHRLFFNRKAQQSDRYPTLHVYLDGDGTPWEMKRFVAADPTARNPLILRLMALDPEPAILLGRPCYYGSSATRPCHYRLWTSHRYANSVVTSLASVLQQWLAGKQVGRLIFIGYSGGGTLAALLAGIVPNVDTLVTIAANLDIDAWSRRHGYSPLSASLNPMTADAIPSAIRQIHLAGLKDTNVPAEIIESFSKTQANSVYVPLIDQRHGCCWADIWPHILHTYLER